MNSTLLITSELTNQSAWKALFTCVVYTNNHFKEDTGIFTSEINCVVLFVSEQKKNNKPGQQIISCSYSVIVRVRVVLRRTVVGD